VLAKLDPYAGGDFDQDEYLQRRLDLGGPRR